MILTRFSASFAILWLLLGASAAQTPPAPNPVYQATAQLPGSTDVAQVRDGWYQSFLGTQLGSDRLLDISSFLPKREMVVNLQQDTNLKESLEPWKYVAPSHLILQANADQRIFFLATSLTDTAYIISPHEINLHIEVQAAARYFSMRGAR